MVFTAPPLTDHARAHYQASPLFGHEDRDPDEYTGTIPPEEIETSGLVSRYMRNLGLGMLFLGLVIGGPGLAIRRWKRALARRRRAKRKARQALADTPYIHLHGRLR
jgi:hypothetical protein